MSLGWTDMQFMKRVEKTADELGFALIRSKHNDYDMDILGLVPKDEESLPIYSRFAELFAGDVNQISKFLAGIKWAREYDSMMKVSTSKKRETQEQKERNRQLAKVIKESA